MRVLWTRSAALERADCVDFIAQDHLLVAIRRDELCGAAVGRLAEHPSMGRPGQVPGVRESTPQGRYRRGCGVQTDPVWILAPVHTARLWPPVRS